MYSKEAQEIAKNCDNRSYMTSLGKTKDKVAVIKSETQWMDKYFKDIENKLRCQVINLGYTEETYPKCKNCNKPVGNGRGDCYHNIFCSDKCSKAFGRLPEDIKQKLSNYDWLYHQRIVLRKAKHTIAAELGCSEAPIVKAIKQLNIPKVRYNEVHIDVKEPLINSELLYQLHKVERKTVKEIGDLIGCSKSRVSTALRELSIKANEPNSYDHGKRKISKQEIEVGKYIASLGFTVKHSNRSILGGPEIDITIAESKICFEYNGLYSHSHEHINKEGQTIEGKSKNFHLDKTIGAAKKGYELYHIWSDDWESRREIVESMIQSKLGVIQNKIYARKCEIVTLSSGEKSAFMRLNHIQGSCKSTLNYALRYNGAVVACMSFKKTTAKGCRWELARFACKTKTTVVGGFTKLLNHFTAHHSGNIISYADLCYSKGSVYEKNGFVLSHVNPPQYWYTKDFSSRLHRASFMKKKIAAIGDNRTEREIMLSMKYVKIYGCGTQAWIYSN